MSKKIEINCYNCHDDDPKQCQLCNGSKKIMVTENFARMIGAAGYCTEDGFERWAKGVVEDA